ncbi:MAG: presenilin family intramembrane aspartyl protease PSH [Methanoregula sp.]|jgi:presenilin-like A22 family membrane protease
MDTPTAKFKNLIPLLAMPVLLLAVEIGALLLTFPVQASGVVAFDDPSSMENPLIFVVILLVFTAFLLVLIKYNLKKVIGAIITLAIFLTFIYIFASIVYAIVGMTAASSSQWWDFIIPSTVINPESVQNITAIAVVILLSLLATAVLYKYPEWYVIDGLGILIAAGLAAILGASLDVLPVCVLLMILAIYDAISVYKTKHMITLAEGVIDQKTPILFVIPKRKNYSFIKEGIGKLADGGERGALIIGMGDMVIPSVLVVSASIFTHGTKYFGLVNLPVIGAVIGSLAGLCVLLYFVLSGKPQAGLPPLNGGTILGFFIGWALISFA